MASIQVAIGTWAEHQAGGLLGRAPVAPVQQQQPARAPPPGRPLRFWDVLIPRWRRARRRSGPSTRAATAGSPPRRTKTTRGLEAGRGATGPVRGQPQRQQFVKGSWAMSLTARRYHGVQKGGAQMKTVLKVTSWRLAAACSWHGWLWRAAGSPPSLARAALPPPLQRGLQGHGPARGLTAGGLLVGWLVYKAGRA